MPDVKLDPPPVRPGVYAPGAETVDAILDAALDVLIEEGASGFSVRRIAKRCGMQVGNVSYHFPRKEMLIHVLLDQLMEGYDQKLNSYVRKPGLSDEGRLRTIINMCLDDIRSQRTTRLFTELWALANHNEVVANRVQSLYSKVHTVIGDYVKAINPSLSEDEVYTLALFISASMEGTTPFLGYRKPWADKMPAVTAISTHWFIELVKTVTPGDIARMTKDSSKQETVA